MIANRVRELRQAHGLSQEKLAQQAGVAAQVIYLLETRPGYGCRDDVKVRLCTYFRVPLGHLFWVEETEDGDLAGTAAGVP